MEKGLLHLHSFLRWVILILLLVAIYKSFADRNKAYTPGHKKTGMLFNDMCRYYVAARIIPVVYRLLGFEEHSNQRNGCCDEKFCTTIFCCRAFDRHADSNHSYSYRLFLFKEKYTRFSKA